MIQTNGFESELHDTFGRDREEVTAWKQALLTALELRERGLANCCSADGLCERCELVSLTGILAAKWQA